MKIKRGQIYPALFTFIGFILLLGSIAIVEAKIPGGIFQGKDNNDRTDTFYMFFKTPSGYITGISGPWGRVTSDYLKREVRFNGHHLHSGNTYVLVLLNEGNKQILAEAIAQDNGNLRLVANVQDTFVGRYVLYKKLSEGQLEVYLEQYP